MMAVWYDSQGPAREVLHFGEQPTPEPAEGEVRVRLHASAVNPADANRRAGRLHGLEFPLIIPNSDGAGVIDAVGPGVQDRRPGQRVWIYFGQRGRPFGTAAEYISLDAGLTMPLPAQIGFAEGACLGIPAVTAWQAVLADGPVQGKTVLVTGGAGAVGHYAVQIAKWAGARVITTVSSETKAGHARKAGADVVLKYPSGGLAAQILDASEGRGVDRIVDVDAGFNSGMVLEAAAPGAVWVSYAAGPAPRLDIPLAALLRKCVTLRGIYMPALAPEERLRAQNGVQRWIEEAPGTLHAVDTIFPLAETDAAHERVESGSKLGTVIVNCAPQRNEVD